jgi:hypothetical protein
MRSIFLKISDSAERASLTPIFLPSNCRCRLNIGARHQAVLWPLVGIGDHDERRAFDRFQQRDVGNDVDQVERSFD